MENLDEKFLQKVFDAADKLKSDGKKTTVRAVEAEIGGGNRNKITEAMKRWREQNAKKQQKEEEEKQLPAEVQNPIYQFAMKMKADAVREVADEKEMIQDDLDNLSDEANRLQAALDAALAEVETLKDALKTAQAEAEARRESYTQLAEEFKQYRDVEQNANEKLAEAKAYNKLAENLLNRVLQMYNDAVRGENAQDNQEDATEQPKEGKKGKRGGGKGKTEPESLSLPMEQKQPG